MTNRTDHGWPWATRGPITALPWGVSIAGWVLLRLTDSTSPDRPFYWMAALGGLALGCTRIAVRSHHRMMSWFSEQIDAAVRRFADAANDSVLNGELVDRVTTEAMMRAASTEKAAGEPPPRSQR